MTKVIKAVTIRPATSPFGNTGAQVVLEDLKDGSIEEGYLFSWFDYEINFASSELVGLTVLEAHRLRHKKHRQK